MTEKWRICKSAPNYEVSSSGRVRRRTDGNPRTWPGRIVSQIVNDQAGYLRVHLYVNKKQKGFLVHRLVAEAFLGPCPKGFEVNHKNGDKTDNRVENLEYVTRGQNNAHAYRTGLRQAPCGERNHKAVITPAVVRSIRQRHDAGERVACIARSTGLPYNAVWKAARRLTWRCVS